MFWFLKGPENKHLIAAQLKVVSLCTTEKQLLKKKQFGYKFGRSSKNKVQDLDYAQLYLHVRIVHSIWIDSFSISTPIAIDELIQVTVTICPE